MVLNNLEMKTNQKIAFGEEALHEVYSPVLVKGKKTLCVGVDGGSTQTRTILFDGSDEGQLENMYTIPSVHSETNSADEIKRQDDNLYQCMDSLIVSQIAPPHNLFDKSRNLRGTKYRDGNLGAEGINSSTPKIDTTAFYINVIDAIAYSIMMQYDRVYEEYDIFAGISLPPDDVDTTVNTNKFLSRIKGSYTWTNKDLTTTIKINIKDVCLQTEPEAAIKAFYASNGKETPEAVLFIEGGGRSIGTEILLNGKSVKPAAKTFSYGGTQLQQNVGNLYRQTYGGGNINEEHLADAVRTGLLKKGRGSQDITDLVMSAKESFSSTVYSDIIKMVFDQQKTVSVESIETIIFSGKLFSAGDYGFSMIKPIATEFKNRINSFDELGKNAPEVDIDVIDLSGTNYIPLGNLLDAYRNFGGWLETVEEDESDISNELIED